MNTIGSLAGQHGTTPPELARAYRSGAFKKREWANRDGRKKTSWNGYVYASDGSKKYGSGKTQREAEAKANAARDKYERSLRVSAPAVENPPMPTFGEWLATYNDHRRKQGRRDSTLGKYKDYAAVWTSIVPDDGHGPLGLRPLPEVTFEALELAIAVLHRRYQSNTVRNMQAYVAGALKRAWLKRLIERAEGALLDPIKRKSKGALELDHDGFAALCRQAAADAPMLAGVILGRFGLRIGETCAASADDLQGNVLTLSRQLDRVDTQCEFGPKDAHRPKAGRVPRKGSTLALTALKSDAAARKIMLTDLEARIFMSALDTAKPDCIWDSVDRRWRTVLFIAHAPQGRAQEEQRLRDRWRKLVKATGLPSTDYHDLRALFASVLADGDKELGIVPQPIKAISVNLGHTSTQITEIYLRGIRKSSTEAWSATSLAIAAAIGS